MWCLSSIVTIAICNVCVCQSDATQQHHGFETGDNIVFLSIELLPCMVLSLPGLAHCMYDCQLLQSKLLQHLEQERLETWAMRRNIGKHSAGLCLDTAIMCSRTG